jgi:hypothetical protein
MSVNIVPLSKIAECFPDVCFVNGHKKNVIVSRNTCNELFINFTLLFVYREHQITLDCIFYYIIL